MKRIFNALLFVVAFLPLSAFADLQTYTIDPSHTAVLWHINHFGFSNPSGKWMASGTIQLDQAKPQNSKVNVTIAMANLTTGVPDLDTHLKDELFFNVAKFPTATFVSDKINVTGKDTANVHGVLTLRDESKPITIAVKLNKAGINPINNKDTVGFTGHAMLNRSDFGISTLLPDLSDKVKIDIECEATKAS
jgi:polyisoprenoid-binding protein YceI